MTTSKSILLVEDEPADAILFKRAMVNIDRGLNVIQVEDGDEAVALLGTYRGASEARFGNLCCVLLDLKMRRMDGFQVLEVLKGKEETSHIPIIVLTSSSDPRDIQRAYQYGANSYIVKPVKADELKQIVSRIHEYWVQTNVCRA